LTYPQNDVRMKKYFKGVRLYCDKAMGKYIKQELISGNGWMRNDSDTYIIRESQVVSVHNAKTLVTFPLSRISQAIRYFMTNKPLDLPTE